MKAPWTLAVIFCVLTLPTIGRAADTSLPVADVIVAKTGSTPLLLWRINNETKRLRAQHVPDSQLLNDLMAEGVLLMENREPTLRDAKTISIRLLYSSNGGVDPRYGLPVMAGIRVVAKLQAPVAALRASSQQLAKATRDGKPSKSLQIEILEPHFSPPAE